MFFLPVYFGLTGSQLLFKAIVLNVKGHIDDIFVLNIAGDRGAENNSVAPTPQKKGQRHYFPLLFYWCNFTFFFSKIKILSLANFFTIFPYLEFN